MKDLKESMFPKLPNQVTLVFQQACIDFKTGLKYNLPEVGKMVWLWKSLGNNIRPAVLAYAQLNSFDTRSRVDRADGVQYSHLAWLVADAGGGLLSSYSVDPEGEDYWCYMQQHPVLLECMRLDELTGQMKFLHEIEDEEAAAKRKKRRISNKNNR